MTTALIVLALIVLALLAAGIWWMWPTLCELGECIRDLNEFHHPNPEDTNDR